MKLKQIMTIGLSTAMVLSAVPAETVVFAADEQTVMADTANAESDIATESAEEGVAAFEADPETVTSDNESADIEFTDSNDETANNETTNNQTVSSEITNDQSANNETINNESANDAIQIEEEQETSDEITIDENIASDDAESVFSDNTDTSAFSDGSAEAADTEYGEEIYSEISEDEASSEEQANGAVIKWTIYNSGTLVIENAEGGNGLTPNRCPWFNYKEDITNVVIKDSITVLGERNFMKCPELKTVTFQGSLSKIGNSAFEGCKKLENISVTGKTNAGGLKVIQLGECVFKDCTGLESAEFTGNFVTNKNAFEGCTSLKSIKVKESTMIMLGEYTFLNCSALIEADLPGSRMKSVGKAAFFDCTSLTQFDFSDVSSIKEAAFYNCRSLASIKIPDGATTIAECAFYGCSGLKSIEIPEKVEIIGVAAFWGCSGIKTLKNPGTVKTIDKTAFGKCTGLEELDIEEGVQTVADAAFADCSSLNTMILPKSVSNFATNFVTDYKPVKKICYRGTRAEWIAANLSSDRFFNAKVYFEYGQDHTHQMITRSYTYPNSCTQPGRKETFCSVCGYVESSETIPAKGHSWKTESTVKKTCTKAGVKHLVCTKCGEKKNETIPAGHSFSAWKTTTGATVFAVAVQTRTCSGCGKKETRKTGKKLTPTMKVNVTALPLKAGQRTNVLKVTGLAKGDSVASWKSSNTNVVKVAGRTNGTCTIAAGKRTGRATITITLKSGLKKNITVTVQRAAVRTTKLSGIARTLNLKRRQTTTLKPVVTPLTSLQRVIYASSNRNVAVVNSRGKITAMRRGTAVITVKSGNRTVRCKVTVR